MLILTYFSYTQSITLSVIGMAGGLEKADDGSTVSWTIGEPIVDPVRHDEFYLTQGFQQPFLKISTGFADRDFTFDLKVYPNPVTRIINLESDYPDTIKTKLVSRDGKLIRQITWNSNLNLQMTQLPAGTYILYHFVKDRIVKSHLILKH